MPRIERPRIEHPADEPWAAKRRLRACFVMEQVLGHVTWYQNLRGAVADLDDIDARWVETRLFDERGFLERLPGVPKYVRAGARAYFDVRRALRDQPVDVLVFNTQKPAIFCQLEMRRTPTILMTDVTPRQYDRMAALYDHTADANPLVRQVKHQTNVLNFRLARAVVAWSTWVRESLISEYGVPPERVHVVPPGVDTTLWLAREPRVAGAARDQVQLLFVGGNFERKGGRVLLDAFRDFDLRDRAHLHVVTRDEVEPPPGVTVHRGLANNSPELRALYRLADIFALPTLADCFSIASIEAMSMSLPVVVTSMGGIPDIVDEGTSGYLVPPGDARALGAALVRLIEDAPKRAAFGTAGRQRVVDRFDARANAARIVALARAVSSDG